MDEVEFTKKRDQHMKGADEYMKWMNNTNDLNCAFYTVFNPLFPALKKDVEILDLCCGPGHIGKYIAIYFAFKKIKPKVTFVDINEERLSAIPKTECYTVVKEDIMKFDKGKYDVISMRNAIYYFDPKTQKKIIKKAYNMLKEQGTFILSSLGTRKDEAEFHTNVHKLIYEMKNIEYKGEYLDNSFFAVEMRKAGFDYTCLIDTLNIWNTNDLAKKYDLSKEEKSRLEDYILNSGYDLIFQKDPVIYGMPAYIIHAIKSKDFDKKLFDELDKNISNYI